MNTSHRLDRLERELDQLRRQSDGQTLRLGRPGRPKEIRLGQLVTHSAAQASLAESCGSTTTGLCGPTMWGFKFVDRNADGDVDACPGDVSGELGTTARADTIYFAAAPGSQPLAADDIVTVGKIGPHWYILQNYSGCSHVIRWGVIFESYSAFAEITVELAEGLPGSSPSLTGDTIAAVAPGIPFTYSSLGLIGDLLPIPDYQALDSSEPLYGFRPLTCEGTVTPAE